MEEVIERKISVKTATLLGKRIGLLFWILIVCVVVGVVEAVLTSGLFDGAFQGLNIVWELIGLVLELAYVAVLISLKKVEDWYYSAGIYRGIGVVVASTLNIIFNDNPPSWTLIILIPTLLVQFYGIYTECTGYEVSVREFDETLSYRWAVQWRWEVWLTVAVTAAPFVMIIGILIRSTVFVLVLLLVMIAAAIGMLVFEILRMIYLYRTAKCFREYNGEEESV